MTADAAGPLRKPLGPSARFFFYGTLLDPDIRRKVLGAVLPAARLKPASLGGYRRVRAAGQWFPILVSGLAGDRVEGVVAHGFTRAKTARLVDYEGPSYTLAEVTVRLQGSGNVAAWVFLPLPGLKPTSEEWNLVEWQREMKPRVLRLGFWPS